MSFRFNDERITEVNLKPQKVKKSVGKYLEEQVPALRQVPYFEDAMGIKPPPR